MLALSFLLLIGMSLVADGFHQHISKGYIYFAMGFSVFVEFVNLQNPRAGGASRVETQVSGGRKELVGLRIADVDERQIAVQAIRNKPQSHIHNPHLQIASS